MAKAAKATYVVEWAETARDDWHEILDYIILRDPLNALKLNDEIQVKANALTHLPQRGRIVPELKFHGVMIYRELLSGPWRLMYRVEGGTVVIVSVLDGRRQLANLLLARFLRS